MADPKKVSRRLASTSGRAPAVKKPAPKPQDDGGEPMFSDEPLIGGDEDVPLIKEESPIKVDNTLISEDTLNASDNSDMRKRFKHIQANKSTQTMPGVDYPAKPAAKAAPEAAKPSPKVSAKLPAAAPAAAKSNPAAKAIPAPAAKPAPASVSKKMPAAKAAPIAKEEDLEDEDLEDEDLEGLEDEEEGGEDEGEELDAKGKKKKADDDLWDNPLEKKKAEEDDEDEEEEDDDKPSKSSSRVTRRMGASSGSTRRSTNSKRATKRDDGDSKTSTKKSIRSEAGGGGKKVPVKLIVIAGVAVFLVLFAVLGFDPLMRHLHTQKLETGATLEERKSGADSLYNRYPDKTSIPLGIFARHIASSDPMLREAAIYGMELLGKNEKAREQVISKFKDEINGVDPAGKVLYVKTLNNIAKASIDDVKGTTDEPSIKAIATMILPLSEPEAPAEVRDITVETLGGLRAPGVCKQLLKLASTETGPLKAKARSGIAKTALPDAAGELLRKMKDPDAELAKISQDAFVRVRDAAKSEDLLPLVSDPSEEVRTKIVEALAKRSGDAKAAQGITTAMGDAKPEIRIMAVRAVPTTHAAPPLPQLTALVSDPVEEVSIANAEIIAKLRDDGSKNVLLGAFKNDLQGKRLEAYITALGKRSTSTVKDFASIGMVMNLLTSNPNAEKSICEALIYLTLAGQGDRRVQARRGWNAAKWQGWWANINEREKLRKSSLEKIKTLAGKKDADRSLFKGFADATREALAVLEKCKEMCSPDDPEDVAALDKEIHDGTRQQEYFFKSAGVDMRR